MHHIIAHAIISKGIDTMTTPTRCECGGNLRFNQSTKTFNCDKCGRSWTRYEALFAKLPGTTRTI